MKKISLYLFISLCISIFSAFARQPAVDPGVSIEAQNEQTQGKVLKTNYKFTTYKLTTESNSHSSTENSGIFVYFVLIAFISLPLISWFIIENTAKNPPIANHDNITNNVTSINKFKKESKTTDEEDEDDHIDKAS